VRAWGIGLLAVVGCVIASGASAGSPLNVTATQQFAPGSIASMRFDAAHDAVWAIDTDSSLETKLVKLDPATLAIESSTPVDQQGQAFYELGVGLGRVWISNFPNDYQDTSLPGTLSEYDGNGTFIRTIPTYGHGPEGIGFADGEVWVANHHQDAPGSGGSVVELDPDSGALIARVSIGAPIFCCGPQELTVADGSVWVGVPNLNVVARIDPVTLSMTLVPGGNGGGRFPGGACGPFAFDPATHSLWSSDGGCRPSAIVRLDSRTGAVTQSFNAGGLAAGLAFGGGMLWATLADEGRGKSGSLVEIDPSTGVVVAKLGVGVGDVAYGDGAVYVATWGSGRIVRVAG
jgi:streptogramin lyase